MDKEATEKLRKEKANTPPPQATPTIKKKSNQKKEASAIPVPPIIGEIYDKPKFLPGGDKYMLIELIVVLCNLHSNTTTTGTCFN